MSSIVVGSIVFACIFGGALIGMILRAILPGQHLNADSKDVVKVCTGLIGTMAALVLGLLVASAKGSYDTTKNELTQLAANMTMLDRLLAHCGPQAAVAREQLRELVPHMVNKLWAEGSTPSSSSAPATAAGETLYESIQQITPASDAQRAMLSQAQSLCADMGKTRMLIFAQRGSSISLPLLIMLVFWETAVFISIGLFAPKNATVIITLFVCALSVASAMYLMLEMDHPYSGLIQLSSEPLRNALAPLSK